MAKKAKPSAASQENYWTTPELKATRLKACHVCKYNEGGFCSQCCGKTAIEIMVHLTAGKCPHNFWK